MLRYVIQRIYVVWMKLESVVKGFSCTYRWKVFFLILWAVTKGCWKATEVLFQSHWNRSVKQNRISEGLWEEYLYHIRLNDCRTISGSSDMLLTLWGTRREDWWRAIIVRGRFLATPLREWSLAGLIDFLTILSILIKVVVGFLI